MFSTVYAYVYIYKDIHIYVYVYVYIYACMTRNRSWNWNRSQNRNRSRNRIQIKCRNRNWNRNCLQIFRFRNPDLQTIIVKYSSGDLKGLLHEIFTVIFWLEWIYLGMKGNRFWFLNFKDVSSILNSYFKYWCVSYQTFSEICRIFEKDWQLSTQFSNFSLFWVSGSLRNAAKGVNTSRRFVESPRMIDNQFSGSPRKFLNNISISIRQLSIFLGDSMNLREGLVWSAPKLKIVAKNRRSFRKMLKPQAVHIRA